MSARRVLITPLDWGLGHATRCIPIIRELLARGHEVLIGSSGSALQLLKAEFPSLRYFALSPYSPVYTASSSLAWKLTLQLAKFIITIRREHRQTERIVKEESIGLVISDNRYGCWSAHAQSIFITHQVAIRLPPGLAWMKNIVGYFNRRQIMNFDQCWVPDWPGERSLAGELAHTHKLPLKYIGPLSRMQGFDMEAEKKFGVAVVLSGPEPQRSVLEKMLLPQLRALNKSALLVRGVPGAAKQHTEGNVRIIDFLTAGALQEAWAQSHIIICRSGYSSIMDLAITGGKAVFIPTPGQTEQQYLARRFMDKGIAFSMPQHEFDLQKALEASGKFTGFPKSNHDHDLLKTTLTETLAPST